MWGEIELRDPGWLLYRDGTEENPGMEQGGQQRRAQMRKYEWSLLFSVIAVN